MRSPAISLSTLVLPLVGALGWAAATADAHAAQPLQRRLQISIDSLREAGVQQGAEQGRGRLAQTLTLDVMLHSDGTPMVDNPLDPDDARRQAERGHRVQRQVESARGRAERAAPAGAAPFDAAAMQAKAQQMQARCGTDRDCLMREASAFSAAQVAPGDPAMREKMAGYAAAALACERKAPAGAARDACVAQARRQAGGADDPTDRDEVVATPYLFFIGQPGCRLDLVTRVDDRVEGTFQDVQGTVAFTQTAQAEQRQRDDASCPLLQAVLDTRNGRLWTHAPLLEREATGVTVRSEKGRRPQRTEGGVALRWMEAQEWVSRRLQNLSVAGADDVRLPAGTPGRVDGQLQVKMRWKFEGV